MMKTFAGHDSKSVQQTLYAMAESALTAVAEISEIELGMPNRHCLLVDLSRFGQDNPNEIFIPTDEPHGYIEARVVRRDSPWRPSTAAARIAYSDEGYRNDQHGAGREHHRAV